MYYQLVLHQRERTEETLLLGHPRGTSSTALQLALAMGETAILALHALALLEKLAENRLEVPLRAALGYGMAPCHRLSQHLRIGERKNARKWFPSCLFLSTANLRSGSIAPSRPYIVVFGGPNRWAQSVYCPFRRSREVLKICTL